ncbi:MAG TPA: hypothetical protein VFB54_12450 [Burkholderiales bacterium]|nr:hypothetical protein [Burkholderiales bacterium]
MSVRPLAWIGQIVLYALFAVIIGWFSSHPRYQHLAPDEALLKISFSHPGQLKAECRRRSAEELAKLAPNMRTALDCPRARSPVVVELALDDRILTRRTVRAAGISEDGPSTLYERFEVPSGEHELSVRINDNVRVAGFNYTREEKVRLEPGRVLVVDFEPAKGGITFQ